MPDLTSISDSNNSRILENIQSAKLHNGKSKLKLPVIKSSRHSTGSHNTVKLSAKQKNFKSSNSPAKRIVKRAASKTKTLFILLFFTDCCLSYSQIFRPNEHRANCTFS